MKSVSPWISSLNISQLSYEGWVRDIPKNEAFTFWCLSTGKINDDLYISWAKEFYGLANLSPDFFNLPPNKQLWEQIKTVANWSEQIIPICEWDGAVFVACVEPPTEIQWSFPVRYVLARSQDMKNYWRKLNDVEDRTFFGIPPTPDKQNQMAEPILSPQDIAYTPPEVDQPIGLNLNLLNKTGPQASTDFMRELAKTVSPINPVKPDQVQQDQIAEVASKVPTNTVTRNTSSSFTSQTISVLYNIKNVFVGGMIIDIQNDMFKPAVWDETFKKAEDNADTHWSLSAPSAFRVAYRTKIPYLGQVANTEINKKFFQAWGFAEMPQTILVQPVVRDDIVIHLILAVGDGLKKNTEMLNAAKKLAEDLILAPTASKVA